MKICIATERMRLGFGVDLVVHEQALRLTSRGYDVTVVVLHADLELQWRPYRLVVLNRFMRFDDVASAAALETVKYRFELEQIDLWILQTPPFYDWARYLDTPVIIVEHGSPSGHFFAPQIGRVIDSVVDRRLHDLYPRLLPCDGIVSISRYIENWLPSDVRDKSTVIYHGAEHYGAVDDNQAAAFRVQLDIAPDECMILWVGRIQLVGDEQPYKGLSELVSLVQLAAPHLPKARFVFAGKVSDEDRHKLQKRGIQVLANLPSEQMAQAYAAADMLINLAKWEGFNLALLEAQYQGTPVLAYNVGPHREVVRHGETGLLVDDPKAFFTTLVAFALDRARREALGRAARAFALGFTWDKSADQLVALIEACLAKELDRARILSLRAQAAGRDVSSAPLEMTSATRVLHQAEQSTLPKGPPTRARLLKQPSALIPSLAAMRLRSMARQAARARDYEVASAYYLQIIALRKAVCADRIQLGHMLKEAGDHSRALETYREAAEIAPLDVDAQRQYGFFLRRLGHNEEAGDVLARASVLDPADEDITAELNRIGATSPLLLDEYTLRGILAAGTVTQSLTTWPFARLMTRRPLKTARLSARRQEWRSAELHYQQVLRRDPGNVRAWVQLGHATLRQGRPEEALQRYRRALASNPYYADTYLHVGHALKEAGRRQSALAAYLTAWRLKPGTAEALREIKGIRPDLDLKRLRDDAAAIGDIPIASGTHPPQSEAAAQALVEQSNGVLAERSLPRSEIDRRMLDRRSGAQRSSFHGGPAPLDKSVVGVAPGWDGAAEVEYHVVKAIGATLSVEEERSILSLAKRTQSDLVFGDTLVIGDNDQATIVAAGAFDHATFLGRPNLGAAIAVRKDLAGALGLARQDLLTGNLLLRLVGGAHTISYAPFRFAVIDKSDFDATLPDEAALAHYRMRAGDAATPISLASGAVSTQTTPVSIAIVVIDQGNVAVTVRDEMLGQVLDHSPAERVEFVLATNREAAAISPTLARSIALRQFDKETSYGEMANAAVEALSDTDILIFLDAGIAPTRSDWISNLAQLAERRDVGAVAPVTLYEDRRIRNAGLTWSADGPSYVDRFMLFDEQDADGSSDCAQTHAIRRVPFLSRHCLAIRCDLFEDLGGFADLGGEAADLALSYRLELAGLARLVDGRTTVTAPDPTPRWKRIVPTDDVARMDELYREMSPGGSGSHAEPGDLELVTTSLAPLPYR